MSVRRATTADAPWVAVLWRRAAPIWATFWPERLQVDYTPDDALRDIESEGQQVYVDDGRQGLFVCHAGYLPEKPSDDPAEADGGLAAQLVIWLAQPGLQLGEYQRLLRELFAFWLQDEIARGEFEYGFGEVPESVPLKSLDFLRGWKIHEVAFERDGAKWLRFWYRMADAIPKLPVTAVSRWPS
jgi:hypothetical protein